MSDARELPPDGLSETPFGLRYYFEGLHALFEVIDLRRKSGELWGELTVRCNLEGIRAQLDGNRMRQGNFNFSSVTARKTWATALNTMTPPELLARLQWENVLERVCQAVLDHEQQGAVHGHELVGKRIGPEGRPWAAWPLLPHGDTATLFAPGGAGKTSLMAEVAFSMGLGRSLVPGIRVDRPYRVGVLDWETNAETAEDLWGLIAETYAVGVPKGIWYEPMEAPLERALPKVANIIESNRLDLVIIDSVALAMLSSGEWSDPADAITRMYQALRKLRTWGLLIDHVAAGDRKRPPLKAYGSIYKLNLARHAIALQIGNRVGDTSQAFLVCPKSNVGRDRWAMAGTVLRSDNELRWHFGPQDYDLFDRLMGEDEDELPEEDLATPRQADLYMEVLMESWPKGLLVGEIRGAVDASSTAYVRKVLVKLQRDGLVVPVDVPNTRAKRWVLTQMGVDWANNRKPDAVD